MTPTELFKALEEKITWVRCVLCGEEWSIKSLFFGVCPNCAKNKNQLQKEYWWNK